eukprot:c2210_g1_i1 orf=1-162(-)
MQVEKAFTNNQKRFFIADLCVARCVFEWIMIDVHSKCLKTFCGLLCSCWLLFPS